MMFFEVIAEIFRRAFGPIMMLIEDSPATAVAILGGGALIIVLIILGVYSTTRE